jgi:hypothetical protein
LAGTQDQNPEPMANWFSRIFPRITIPSLRSCINGRIRRSYWEGFPVRRANMDAAENFAPGSPRMPARRCYCDSGRPP